MHENKEGDEKRNDIRNTNSLGTPIPGKPKSKIQKPICYFPISCVSIHSSPTHCGCRNISQKGQTSNRPRVRKTVYAKNEIPSMNLDDGKNRKDENQGRRRITNRFLRLHQTVYVYSLVQIKTPGQSKKRQSLFCLVVNVKTYRIPSSFKLASVPSPFPSSHLHRSIPARSVEALRGWHVQYEINPTQTRREDRTDRSCAVNICFCFCLARKSMETVNAKRCGKDEKSTIERNSLRCHFLGFRLSFLSCPPTTPEITPLPPFDSSLVGDERPLGPSSGGTSFLCTE